MKISPRGIAVRLHRYAGLALAGFLIVSGLTGSVIAFHHELDRRLNPDVLTVRPAKQRLPPDEWVSAAETKYPGAVVTYLTIPRRQDEPAVLYVSPRLDEDTGEPVDLPGNIDQIFLDPGSGRILGARDRDGFVFDRLHAIPFIYTLHYSLHLGQWGMWLFGGIALIWFIDCFVGLYLAWPKRAWRTIRGALSVKRNAGAARVHYDLHRATGLWFWLILIVLAFSGVSLNLHDEVFDPVVNVVAPMTPSPSETAPDREDPQAPLALPLVQALAQGDRGLQRAGFEGEPGAVWFNYPKGLYHIGFHTDQDIMRAYPGTWVTVAAADGEILDVRPAGGHTIGDAIHDWQFPLHSGEAFGLTGRIVISFTGIAVAVLSVTGVAIWWRRHRRRRGGDPKASRSVPRDSRLIGENRCQETVGAERSR